MATWAFDVELIEVCSLVNLILPIFIWSKRSSLTFLLCGFSKYLKNTYIPSSFYQFSNLLGIISNLFFCFKFDNQVILRCYGLCDFAGGFIISSILDCLVRSFFRVWELISFSNFVAYRCNIFAWHLVSFFFGYADIDHFIKLWTLFLYSFSFF